MQNVEEKMWKVGVEWWIKCGMAGSAKLKPECFV